MGDNPTTHHRRVARGHDEAADHHMRTAVLWRDLGQAHRAVLEVRHAMVERQLAQLARDRAELEERDPDRPNGSADTAVRVVPPPPARGEADRQGVQLVYEADGWRVEVDGKPHSFHQFQIAAVVVAHETARQLRRDLLIRGRSGSPRELVSYRDDPARQNDPPRNRLSRLRPELRRA